MAGMGTIAALKVALDLDKKSYEEKLKGAETEAQRAKIKLERVFSRVAVAGAAVGSIAAATNALGRLAEQGGRALTVQTAFNRATGDGAASLDLLRSATRGLVSDTELMTQANMALTLGSANSAEQFAQLATTAQELGRALGLDTAFALNSLNVGIARQSRLVLDNLGLIVSVEEANRKYADALGVTVAQLSDAEKKEAFRIEAMEQSRAKLEQLGPTALNAGDAFVQFRTEVSNTVDALGKVLAESTLVEFAFRRMADAARTLRGETGADMVQLRFGIGTGVAEQRERAAQLAEDRARLDEYSESVRKHNEQTQMAAERYGRWTTKIEELKLKLLEMPAVLQTQRNELTGNAQATEIVAAQIAGWQEELTGLIDPMNEADTTFNKFGWTAGEVTDRIADSEKHRRMMAEGLKNIGDQANYAAGAMGKLGRFTSLLGGFANLFGGFGVASSVLGNITSGLGLGGSLGDVLGIGRGGPKNKQAVQMDTGGVTVVLNGPGLETLVDTITVQQGRSRDLRRVRRV